MAGTESMGDDSAIDKMCVLHTLRRSTPTLSTASNGLAPADFWSQFSDLTICVNSMYGRVYRAVDRATQEAVLIKQSLHVLTKAHCVRPSMGFQSAATEDVGNEVALLQLLQGPPIAWQSVVDQDTCGLTAFSATCMAALDRLEEKTADTDTNGREAAISNVRTHLLPALMRGCGTLIPLLLTHEDDVAHCMVFQFAIHGDLFNALKRYSGARFPESVARFCFRQICEATAYLHAHSVAHLDLSLENVCIDDKGQLRLIDLGMAVQHPLYQGSRKTFVKLAAVSHAVLARDDTKRGSCGCCCCAGTVEELAARQEKHNLCGPSSSFVPRSLSATAVAATAVATVSSTSLSSSSVAMLLRPRCAISRECVGKTNYMSPEYAQRLRWDAYKHDMFALGVILFMLLVGHGPHELPHPTDRWFKHIFTGEWTNERKRFRGMVHLNPHAVQLIDSLLKPQADRPTIDELLQHAWFTDGPEEPLLPLLQQTR